MTTAQATECPQWCTQSTPDRACRGEHSATVGDYVPATSGLPRGSGSGGVNFPSIGVALSWDTLDCLQPSISLHISGEGIDEQPDLHLHEARELIANLTRAVAMLEARAEA